MRPGYDPWEHPPRFDDDRADIATAGNFINNRVAFPARTRGESSFEEERGDETGNKTRLPVDQNREAGEGCASALREQETLSCDDVISILPGPVSGFPDRRKALKEIQPDSQKRGMTFRTEMRNQTKHGR
jgi:hypothetical protein